jgi:hypothetical protein
MKLPRDQWLEDGDDLPVGVIDHAAKDQQDQ